MKPDPKELPYLIRLLDDESETVRNVVMKELTSYGSELSSELTRQEISLDRYQKEVLRELLENQNQIWIREAWPCWFDLEDDYEKLESALSLIAEFQYGRDYPIPLTFLLDQFAEDYNCAFKDKDALMLSKFLFEMNELKGAEADYYNPMNSNLNYVIEKRRGIPISLACIYMLVGHRLGLEIHGLNLPGHFLARAYSGSRKFIVDCYNHGQFVDETRLDKAFNSELLSAGKIAHLECRSEVIIARVLKNLIRAYQLQNDTEHVELMNNLFEMISHS